MKKIEKIQELCNAQPSGGVEDTNALVELIEEFFSSVSGYPVGYTKTFFPHEKKRISLDNPSIRPGLSNLVDNIRFSFIFGKISGNPDIEVRNLKLMNYAEDLGLRPRSISVIGYLNEM